MKNIRLLVLSTIMLTTSINAQQLKVVDINGDAVPYALVTNSDAGYIGITDIDGVLADVAGAKKISITHVAFKAKNIKLEGKHTTVTLENVDFDTHMEIDRSKPYYYCQVYFRLFFCNSKGIHYYRVGVTDNIYERASKKMTSKTNVISTTNLDKIYKSWDQNSQMNSDAIHLNFEERLKKWSKPVDLAFTNIESGKKSISYDRDTIGYINENINTQKRKCFFNYTELIRHKLGLMNETKTLEQWRNNEQKSKNHKRLSYVVTGIIDQEIPEATIMNQELIGYDYIAGNSKIPCVVVFQMFITKRCDFTKTELQGYLKNNKKKITYLNSRQYELDCKIPLLPLSSRQHISELWGTVE